MLVVGNATNQTRTNHDRRRREGAGTPADVWALGCLLYELLTGSILFYDPDWIRFFMRLTQSSEVHALSSNATHKRRQHARSVESPMCFREELCCMGLVCIIMYKRDVGTPMLE